MTLKDTSLAGISKSSPSLLPSFPIIPLTQEEGIRIFLDKNGIVSI
jgi:hypothetical protein